MEDLILTGKYLLVVDDEVDLRDIVASELEFMGAHVYQAENVTTAQKLLEQHHIDLVISDIRMPGGTGIDLLKYVKARDVHAPPVILITGFADITNEDAFNKGAEALLSKPFKLEELIKCAVKLTEPVETKFKEKESQFKKLDFTLPATIKGAQDSKGLSFGRGGLTITLDHSCTKCETGELLSFDFTFEDAHLKGVAICRWWKPLDQKVVVGLEFVHLSDETLQYFMKFWKDQSLIPFIPSLES